MQQRKLRFEDISVGFDPSVLFSGLSGHPIIINCGSEQIHTFKIEFDSLSSPDYIFRIVLSILLLHLLGTKPNILSKRAVFFLRTIGIITNIYIFYLRYQNHSTTIFHNNFVQISFMKRFRPVK